MSNPVIAAFHTILTLQRPAAKTIYHMDSGPLTTYAFSGILPSPFCSPFRHPIWWWKFRHLRADIRLLEEEVDPALSKRMRELEDEAFLNGTGK